MPDFLQDPAFASQITPWLEIFLPLVAALAVLDLALRGWALWRSAKLNRQGWFIALLLINSVGILPAIFLITTNEEYLKRKQS